MELFHANSPIGQLGMGNQSCTAIEGCVVVDTREGGRECADGVLIGAPVPSVANGGIFFALLMWMFLGVAVRAT